MAKACMECRKPFVGYDRPRGGPPKGRFCSAKCRQKFHVRRHGRGMKVYDLVMAWRFDRKGDGPEAMKILCEMASTFRDWDKAAGIERSWLTLRENADNLTPFKTPSVSHD